MMVMKMMMRDHQTCFARTGTIGAGCKAYNKQKRSMGRAFDTKDIDVHALRDCNSSWDRLSGIGPAELTGQASPAECLVAFPLTRVSGRKRGQRRI